MRPATILHCSIAAALVSTAQPARAQVLTAPNAIPLVGDTFTTHSVDYGVVFNTGPIGVGSTWDFSGFIIDGSSYVMHACIDPATAPGYGAFPTCDVVLKGWPGPGISAVFHDYFDTQAEGLFKVGHGGEAWIHDYSTPDLVQAVPLSYGMEVNTPHCYTAIGFGVPVQACGGTRQSLDGDGTLILPYGPLPYTVRTKHERYNVDDSAPTDTSFSTVYRWWAPQVRWPVLEMSTTIATDGTVAHSAMALDPSLFTGVEEFAGALTRAYPVPFQDHLTIDVSPALLQAGPVLFRAADGRLVGSIPVSGGMSVVTLDPAGLPAGPIFMEMITDRGRMVHNAIHLP